MPPHMPLTVVASDVGRTRGVLRLRSSRLLAEALQRFATDPATTASWGATRQLDVFQQANALLPRAVNETTEMSVRLQPLLQSVLGDTQQFDSYTRDLFAGAAKLAGKLNSGDVATSQVDVTRALRSFSRLISLDDNNRPTVVPRGVRLADTHRLLAVLTAMSCDERAKSVLLTSAYGDDDTNYETLLYQDDNDGQQFRTECSADGSNIYLV